MFVSAYHDFRKRHTPAIVVHKVTAGVSPPGSKVGIAFTHLLQDGDSLAHLNLVVLHRRGSSCRRHGQDPHHAPCLPECRLLRRRAAGPRQPGGHGGGRPPKRQQPGPGVRLRLPRAHPPGAVAEAGPSSAESNAGRGGKKARAARTPGRGRRAQGALDTGAPG